MAIDAFREQDTFFSNSTKEKLDIGKLAKSEQSVFLPNRQGPMKENT